MNNKSDDNYCQGASTVLLLIIPNPSSTILPHSLFYRIFSYYGVVEKILIFEKSRLWKSFVEMQTIEQAHSAQQALNGTTILDGGVMNVYFSNFRTVTLVNNNSGGVDYRQLRQSLFQKRITIDQIQMYQKNFSSINDNNNIIDNSDNNKNNYYNNNDNEQIQLNAKQMQRQERKPLRLRKNINQQKSSPDDILSDSIQQKQISINDDQNNNMNAVLIHDDDMLFDIIKQQQFLPNQDEQNDDISQYNDNTQINDQQYINISDDEYITQQDQEIMNAFSKNNEYNFMFSVPNQQSKSKSQQFSTPFQQNIYQPLLDPANYVNPQFMIENQPSKVIYVRGLHSLKITSTNIFNLFSNCGNIVTVIFIKHKYSALIQFEKLQYAQNAKDHLNNQNFMSAKLQIQLPLPYSSPLTEVFVPNIDMYRFSDGRNLVFNPPSQVLHISNIQKEIVQDQQMFIQLFNQIGQIMGLKFINVQKQKHMALIKMSSIQDALQAASELHGYEFMGRKINISFTKSKI